MNNLQTLQDKKTLELKLIELDKTHNSNKIKLKEKAREGGVEHPKILPMQKEVARGLYPIVILMI